MAPTVHMGQYHTSKTRGQVTTIRDHWPGRGPARLIPQSDQTIPIAAFLWENSQKMAATTMFRAMLIATRTKLVAISRPG